MSVSRSIGQTPPFPLSNTVRTQMADSARLEAMARELYNEMVQGLVLDGVFAAHKEIERARQSCSVCGSQLVGPSDHSSHHMVN